MSTNTFQVVSAKSDPSRHEFYWRKKLSVIMHFYCDISSHTFSLMFHLGVGYLKLQLPHIWFSEESIIAGKKNYHHYINIHDDDVHNFIIVLLSTSAGKTHAMIF